MLNILISTIAIWYHKINFLTGLQESFQKVHTSTTLDPFCGFWTTAYWSKMCCETVTFWNLACTALFNPIQARVFCYYIGWGGGGTLCSPSASSLFFVQLPNLAWYYHGTKSLKAIKVKSIMTSLWRIWRHLCSVEYQELLKTAYV